MSQKDTYRYYCTTENKYIKEKVDIDSAAPSVCQTDGGHTVDWATLHFYKKAARKADVGLANIVNVKDKSDATTAPASTDDSTSGYSVNSQWVDVTNDKNYVCLDATTSSAVWKETTIIDHVNLSNIGTNTHAQIDTHIANTSNPHSTTATQLGLGNVLDIKHKIDGTVAPSASDDTGSGYSAGSVWTDTAGNTSYICVDATASSAVWTNITAGASGGETNTASNVGTGGVGVLKQKSGVDFEFKKINSGASGAITVTDDTGNNEIDLSVDINGLTADATPDSDADYVMTYDASASGLKKVLINNLPAAALTYQEVTATATTNTSSSSYVLINGMTITPASGTYFVSFSCSGVIDDRGTEFYVAIYSGGTIVGHTERIHEAKGSQGKNTQTIHTQCVTTVNGSQAIEARFKQSTYTIYKRSMAIIKLS